MLDLLYLPEIVTKSVLDEPIAKGISDHAQLVSDLSVPRCVYVKTAAERYRDFSQANHIDITEFLKLALDRFFREFRDEREFGR